jgi:hypothetical protein
MTAFELAGGGEFPIPAFGFGIRGLTEFRVPMACKAVATVAGPLGGDGRGGLILTSKFEDRRTFADRNIISHLGSCFGSCSIRYRLK